MQNSQESSIQDFQNCLSQIDNELTEVNYSINKGDDWSFELQEILSELGKRNFGIVLDRMESFIPLNYKKKPVLLIVVMKLHYFKLLYNDASSASVFEPRIIKLLSLYKEHSDSIQAIKTISLDPIVLYSKYYQSNKESQLCKAFTLTLRKSLVGLKSVSLSRLTSANDENFCLITRENFNLLMKFEIEIENQTKAYRLSGFEIGFDEYLHQNEAGRNKSGCLDKVTKHISVAANYHQEDIANKELLHTDKVLMLDENTLPLSEPSNLDARLQKKVMLPSLKEFNFKVLKRENINKKVVSKFKKHLMTLKPEVGLKYSNTIQKVLSLGCPPCYYEDESYKSFNTKFMQLVFSFDNVGLLFSSFIKLYSESILLSICKSYKVNLVEEVEMLRRYLTAFPFIFTT